ncbi:MAG TPA: hypothetical protein PJ988_07990 [Anaerolinea sp.]|nr:hypothetical protein [Anaerolinea sp.]
MAPVSQVNERPAGRERLKAGHLSEEIDMLRDLMRRLAEQAGPEADLNRQVRLLGALSQASARLAQVLRVQAQLGGGSAHVAELRQMADEIRQDLERHARARG